MTLKEGFVGRWSRLKAEPEAPAAGDADAPDKATVPTPPEATVEDERSDAEILDELGLPHPDDMKPGDDVRGFMDVAVPDRLRRLALRRLWRSNPVLANIDGLVDYGEDFTNSATVVENMQTLYQVGKGMWREVADDKSDAAADDEDPADMAGEADTRAPSESESSPTDPQTADTPPDVAGDAQTVEDDADGGAFTASPAPARRRMAFRFRDEIGAGDV